MRLLTRRKPDEMKGATPTLSFFDEINDFRADFPEDHSAEERERAEATLRTIEVREFMGQSDEEIVTAALDVLRGPFRDRVIVLP